MTRELTALPPVPQMSEDVYEVYSMTYAQAPDRRTHENFIFHDMHDGPMAVDFNLWILRNAHRTILVDTGFSRRAAEERGRPLDFDPLDGLARLGLDPAEIEHVIVTHLHFDHAGNIDRLPRARIHVQDAEVAYATGRCMCHAHIRRPFDVEDVAAMVRSIYADRVTFHDGDAAPFPGVTLHVLPGHSKGLQAVRVMTPRGSLLLASDVSHYYANFLNMAPFALTIDAPETLRSYRKMLTLAASLERIIPGHDPKVRAIYPGLSVAGVPLVALHEEPRAATRAQLAAPGDAAWAAE